MNKYERFLNNASLGSGRTLTSTMLIIIIMVTFLIGIGIHLITVFDSVWLAIGMQSVVLVTATNSDILPHKTMSNGVSFSVIPLLLAFLSWVFIFDGYGGFELAKDGDWFLFTKALIKAFGISTAEYLFSFIFGARYKQQLKELNKVEDIKISPIVDTSIKNDTNIPIDEIKVLNEPEKEIKVIEEPKKKAKQKPIIVTNSKIIKTNEEK